MPDQNTDPKTQGQGQTPVAEENNEHVAFGGSEDFFDDPNFLNKIGQGNSSPAVEETEEVNLGDINNIFENTTVDTEKDESENLDLGSISNDVAMENTESIKQNTPEEIIVEENPGNLTELEQIDTMEPEPIVETPHVDTEPIIEESVVEDSIVENEDEKEDIIEDDPVEESTQSTVETTPEVTSDFVKKFNELKIILSDINEVKGKLGYGEGNFDVIGANSDVNKVTYSFGFDDGGAISITKIELDKKTKDESEHTLVFDIENGGLTVGMDEVTIFEENKDLQNDQKKKTQVMEKINKFIFLAGEYQRTMQIELKEKLEEEQEKKKMQDIFRNF